MQIIDRLVWEVSYWKQWLEGRHEKEATLLIESCEMALQAIKNGVEPSQAMRDHLMRKGFKDTA